MYLDINTKKLKKNAFRVSKNRGETASRVRVPGGKCSAQVLQQVADIAQEYGNGSVHLTPVRDLRSRESPWRTWTR